MNQRLKILSGPVFGFLAFVLMGGFEQATPLACMAGVAIWIALWWITEAVNIFFTSLLPLILFPFLGIMGMKEVAPLYMNKIIFLFVGGFLLAYAFERWNLHRRIALKIIVLTGSTPSKMLLGFMAASYLLSMWIMNTATATMLLPAVLGVINQVEKMSERRNDKMATGFLLGVAFAASIGGMATLVGTAPNMVLANLYNERFGDTGVYEAINFGNWFLFAFPLSLVMFTSSFFILKALFFRDANEVKIDLSFIQKDLKAMGKMSYEETMVSLVFVITVGLWFFRRDIEIGSFSIPGWRDVFAYPSYITDGTVAMLSASVLFLIPSKNEGAKTLIAWEDFERLPLGIIFLFGGGFALATGISSSGLAEWIANGLTVVVGLSPLLMVLILCFFMTFFTEITSNTASTFLMLPLIIELALKAECHPLLLMIPVTISASCAFMLPVATPPNTIVFGSNRIALKTMMRTGIWLNLLGIILITFTVFSLGKVVFGF
ncbi:MAG: SLC13/DASS family transporter [Flavobacteriales bacterium]|nr:SLC13/DASS family transporter [Flavobacteriales bacterium]